MPVLQFRRDNLSDGAKAFFVFGIEAIQLGAIDIEDAEQMRIGAHQRDNDFRFRRAVAHDVAGKLVHVRDANRGSPFRRRPHHAASELNSHASRPPLKGTEHQLASFEQIKPDPIQSRHRVKQHGRAVGHVRNGVRFVLDERGDLSGQLTIQFRLRELAKIGRYEHALNLSHDFSFSAFQFFGFYSYATISSTTVRNGSMSKGLVR